MDRKRKQRKAYRKVAHYHRCYPILFLTNWTGNWTRGHSVFQIIAELRKSLLGWKAYFGIAEIQSPQRELEKWIRRKLRCYIWKQWGRSGYRKLRRHGVARQLAWNTAKSAHGPWRLSASPALYYA